MKTNAIILSAVFLLFASLAAAKSEYLDAAKVRYNIPNSSKLNDCSTCHAVIGGSWDRNSYGAQLQTAGIKDNIPAAFDATDDLNADNDPALNWVEMVNGTWPADPNDFVPVESATWGKIKNLFNR
jgi:hypothetical protein